jgi:hypothetical protein
MILHKLEKKSYDDVTFAEFDHNFNFIPDDILPDFVTHPKNHRNCSPFRMNFVCDGIVHRLME